MSVPVLSVHTTVASPIVSIAASWLTTAPRLAISRAPSASAIVTVAESPSGTAATATETPTRNASRARLAAGEHGRREEHRDADTEGDHPHRQRAKPALQRGRRGLRAVGEARDQALLGALSRRSHERATDAARDSRPGVEHRRAVAERRRRRDLRDALGHGQRLSGEQRLVDLEARLPHQAHVRGNAVALADAHEIPGDEVGDGHLRFHSVPDHHRQRLEAAAQRQHGALGTHLLGEPEGAVEDDDERDRACFDRLADECRDERGDEEQRNERVEDLPQRDPRVRGTLGPGERVRADDAQPGCGLAAGETRLNVTVELLGDLLGRERMGREACGVVHTTMVAAIAAVRQAEATGRGAGFTHLSPRAPRRR